LDARPHNERQDECVFYVIDDPPCRFVKNAFRFDALKDRDHGSYTPVVPGVSFFDRVDQRELFKLHLPYIFRTSGEVDTLFLPLINRSAPVDVLSGLVETDWYANPVNLILRQPQGAANVHISKGDPVAQLVFIERSHRRPQVTVVPAHARFARELKLMMSEWHRRHSADRSAYKQLVRSQHGQVDTKALAPRSSSREVGLKSE
jgi:hypothetical protein